MTNKNIYPYVYRLDHPITGEFYIGSRCANKVPAHLDLGIKYKTSSKYVKPRFTEFTYIIVAEFFDAGSAYDFEQELIHESWGLPGLMNKVCHHGKLRFSTTGLATNAGVKQTSERKAAIAAAKFGKKQTPEHRAAIARGNTGKKRTEEQNAANSRGKLGVARSAEMAANLSTAKIGARWFTDGISDAMIMRDDSPPLGWSPGRTYRTSVGSKWFTNGTSSRMIQLGLSEPPGWYPGRHKKN